VESVTVSGEGRSLLRVVGEGVDSNDLISKLRRKVGHADIVELHTLQAGRGYASSSATGGSGGYHSVHDGARSDSAAYGQYSNYHGPSYSPVPADPYYYRHQQPSFEYYSPPPYPATVVFQVILVELLGTFAGTVHLSGWLWLMSVLIGSFSLVVGALIKCIPISSGDASSDRHDGYQPIPTGPGAV
jgi:hypothetical protein